MKMKNNWGLVIGIFLSIVFLITGCATSSGSTSQETSPNIIGIISVFPITGILLIINGLQKQLSQ
jgi:hypothetical protein